MTEAEERILTGLATVANTLDELTQHIARLGDIAQQRLDLDKAVAETFGGKLPPAR